MAEGKCRGLEDPERQDHPKAAQCPDWSGLCKLATGQAWGQSRHFNARTTALYWWDLEGRLPSLRLFVSSVRETGPPACKVTVNIKWDHAWQRYCAGHIMLDTYFVDKLMVRDIHLSPSKVIGYFWDVIIIPSFSWDIICIPWAPGKAPDTQLTDGQWSSRSCYLCCL